jgi:ATP-dependent exoDNAse (exonuclease V) beta subunit
MLEQATDEHRRLLYVSCTRARDIMVLPHRSKGGTAWLDTIGASQLFFAGVGDIQLDDGTAVRRARRPWTLPEIASVPPARVAVERRWLIPRTRQEHLPLWLRPSAAPDGAHCTESVENVGTRIALKARVDMTSLGSAVHNFIAFYVASGGAATKEDVAAVLARWRIGAAVEAEAVLEQAQALLRWVESKWAGARVWTEVPVEVKLKSGRIVKGQIDLLVELAEGWVLIDHKADPRSAAADGARLAQAHGSQLDAYAEAVFEGTGRAVIERWLFLPVAGQAVRVGAPEAPATLATSG